MTTFSAEPGTWLINLDPDVHPIPIIGWDKGPAMRAWPILPMRKKALYCGDAIRLPGTGHVIDPVWGRTFGSEEEWRDSFQRNEPYEPGTLPGEAQGGKKRKSEPPVRTTTVDIPEGALEVLAFGEKTYKNKSYWHHTGDPEFCFEIPGEEVCPVGDKIEKITRDAYFKLRKEIPSTTVTPSEMDFDAEEPESDDEDEDDDLI